VLIAGDIYDKPVPSAETVGLLDDFLTALAGRGKPVVVISGNHDSAERLAFGGRLFTARGLYLSPVSTRRTRLLRPCSCWTSSARLLCGPCRLSNPRTCATPARRAGGYLYPGAVRGDRRHALDKAHRNVLVCHQFVTGATRSESEDVSVGGLDNVDASVFDAFDYVALGTCTARRALGGKRCGIAARRLSIPFRRRAM